MEIKTMIERKRELDWVNILFLTLSPLIGIFGTAFYVYKFGIHPLEIFLFAFFYFATGLSITAGYHRFFAHRSYECHPLLKFFYLVFGACAVQNSVLRWASDHRMHHKYVDTDLDPYNVKRGGFYAHMGWIFFKKNMDPELKNFLDFRDDPMVVWQNKYYVPIAVGVGFMLPCAIGFLVGRPVGALLWGGFFRVVFVHHATFLINSLAHIVGDQTYSDEDTSRDSGWLALLTYGEGYHNYHHKFQADYRNGVRWYHWDPSKWLIRVGNFLGLTWRLNRTPNEKILQARIAMEMRHLNRKLNWAPRDLMQKIHVRLEGHRAKLQIAQARFAAAKLRYREMKAERLKSSEEVLRTWKVKLRITDRRFQREKAKWQEALQAVLLEARNFRVLSAPKIY